MTEIMIIANPAAGKGKALKAGNRVCEILKQHNTNVEIVVTERAGDAARFAAEAAAQGARIVAVSGGDGSVNEVIGSLVNTGTALGIIPSGRGNDLARVIGIKGGPDCIARILDAGILRKIDVGRIGNRFFATVACMGFDSHAARLMHNGSIPFSGTAAYIFAVLKTLLTYRCSNVSLEGDFGKYSGPVFLAATGNTTTYGGGMKITPDACDDDGVFDVCIIRNIPLRVFFRHFLKIFRGSHTGLNFVEMKRTKWLSIESEKPQWIFADGEPMGETPARLEILPRALSLVVPG